MSRRGHRAVPAHRAVCEEMLAAMRPMWRAGGRPIGRRCEGMKRVQAKPTGWATRRTVAGTWLVPVLHGDRVLHQESIKKGSNPCVFSFFSIYYDHRTLIVMERLSV